MSLEPDRARAGELAREANLIPLIAREIQDTETPVSAFLKLRNGSPAYLLESAEQGRLGRYSFLGFRPRSLLRWAAGTLSEWSGEAAAAWAASATPPQNECRSTRQLIGARLSVITDPTTRE